MHETRHPDQISLLASAMAQRLAPLCPHVPAGELAELTSRLATSELMRAGHMGSAPAPDADEAAPATGNQVVWLPGASGVAIVLPAGEADPARMPSVSQVLERARSEARRARVGLHRAAERVARGSAAARERALGMLNAWQVRPRTELPDQ